jgi:hypothetical protein
MSQTRQANQSIVDISAWKLLKHKNKEILQKDGLRFDSRVQKLK